MTRRFIDTSRIMHSEEVQARFGLHLKPCPFCAAEHDIGLFMGPRPHVTCMNCEADGPIPDKHTQHEPAHVALVMWNDRGGVIAKKNTPRRIR